MKARELVSRVVPVPIKRAARRALQALRLRRALARLRALSPGVAPSRPLLAELREAWGNAAFSADLDYLDEVAQRAARVAGPVLECGSGLTTLILGTLTARRGVPVWTLEHLPSWHARVSEALARHHIGGVQLCLAPLRNYDDFTWYEAPLDRMPRAFSLVVCDGPPGTTPGGRYGLLPRLGERLSPDCVILLDDANRPSEIETLGRWEREAPFSSQRKSTPAGVFAVVTGERTERVERR